MEATSGYRRLTPRPKYSAAWRAGHMPFATSVVGTLASQPWHLGGSADLPVRGPCGKLNFPRPSIFNDLLVDLSPGRGGYFRPRYKNPW